MAEERKLVTVLFADIVGFTSLTGHHAPEVIRRSLGVAFAMFREVLTQHGGTVEKFIGDAVMAVFGIPIAHDDDADRAVRAAFGLQQALLEVRRSIGLPLEIRIGVNTGEVLTGIGTDIDFLVTGEAVNVAARLQQAAEPGDILVGGVTWRLTHPSVQYADARLVPAKGYGDLEAFPAQAIRSTRQEGRRLRAPMVGREIELRELVDGYERVLRERRGQLITVIGPAGSGKSRLAREFALTIGEERVRRGRCLPYGQGITLWPFREILLADTESSPTNTADEVVAKLKALLPMQGDRDVEQLAILERVAVLCGAARPEDALNDVRPEDVMQELRWGLLRYLHQRASQGPLTLIIDDVHWAEPALLELLEHLVGRLDAPVLLLCLARPELFEHWPNWAKIGKRSSHVELKALSHEDATLLATELLGRKGVAKNALKEIIAKAEGNPLFVEELLGMLIDSKQLDQVGDRWALATTVDLSIVPPTIKAVIAARLDQLQPDVRRLLQRAAVAGRAFSYEALSAMGIAAGIESLLPEAERRDFLIRTSHGAIGGGDAFRFKHMLIRDVAYSSLPLDERGSLHETYGRWLDHLADAGGGEYTDLVAYHAEQAFHYAEQMESSAAEARGLLAFEQLVKAATHARKRADNHAALVLYVRAARVADAVVVPQQALVEIRGFAALARFQLEGTSAALRDLDDVLDQVRAFGPSEALARMLPWRAFVELQDSVESARRLFDECIRAARATGDPELVAQALVASQCLYWWVGDLAGHRRLLEQARSYVHSTGAFTELGPVLRWLTVNLRECGDLSAAVDLWSDAAETIRRTGSKTTMWLAAQARGSLARICGDLDQAIRFHEEALSIANDTGARVFIGRACEELGSDLYEVGQLPRSRSVLEAGISALDRETMREALPELQWRLARTCLALGDIEAARSYAEAGRATVAPTDVYSQTTTRISLAHVEEAEGNVEVADRLFREAISGLTESGYGNLTADVQEDYANFLARHDDARRAVPLLESAAAFWHDPLAGHRRKQVRDSLRRCRRAVEIATSPTPDSP